jgi:hypothetical protein
MKNKAMEKGLKRAVKYLSNPPKEKEKKIPDFLRHHLTRNVYDVPSLKYKNFDKRNHDFYYQLYYHND